MRHHVLLAAIALALVAPVASLAQDKGKKQRDDRPRDLSAYSLRFWPQNMLKYGETVSTTTPYGRLTCRSLGAGPRECTLDGSSR